jgi:hypothetical protein
VHVDPLDQELEEPRLFGWERVILKRILERSLLAARHGCPVGAFYKVALASQIRRSRCAFSASRRLIDLCPPLLCCMLVLLQAPPALRG